MKELKEIYLNWVKDKKVIFNNLRISVLSKLSKIAFLAQRISSINSLSAICEVTGADIRELANALGKDSRICDKFLKASPAFGEVFFKKDILNMVYLARYCGLDKVAAYWEKVVDINDWKK